MDKTDNRFYREKVMENNAVATISPPEQNFLTVVAELAANKDVDIAKIQALMNMQEHILNRNAKQAYAADFIRMKPKLPKVARTKRNEQTKSNYAPLEDINLIVDPILEEFGFATSTKVVGQTPEGVTVRAELWHSGGHMESTDIFVPLDNKGPQGTVNKTGPHATASSVMYGRRIAICALLNISTGNDTDGNLPQGEITTEQAVEIDVLIGKVGADKPKFLSFMGVDDVRKIRVADYKKAVNALNSKKGTVNAAA